MRKFAALTTTLLAFLIACQTAYSQDEFDANETDAGRVTVSVAPIFSVWLDVPIVAVPELDRFDFGNAFKTAIGIKSYIYPASISKLHFSVQLLYKHFAFEDQFEERISVSDADFYYGSYSFHNILVPLGIEYSISKRGLPELSIKELFLNTALVNGFIIGGKSLYVTQFRRGTDIFNNEETPVRFRTYNIGLSVGLRFLRHNRKGGGFEMGLNYTAWAVVDKSSDLKIHSISIPFGFIF